MKQAKAKLLLSLSILLLVGLSNNVLAQNKTSSQTFEIKNEDLKEYVGQYNPDDNSYYFNITISMDGDDRLMAQPTDKSQPNTLMVATEKDYFDLAGTPLVINFNRDDAGKIESLTFTQGQQSFTAKKVKTP